MKLIADSGSTKTLWVLMNDGIVVKTARTSGMNPYFITENQASAILQEELIAELKEHEKVKEVFFYGAGCSTENNRSMLKKVLQPFFSGAVIQVFHDILGAARALCGDNEGIACILGTGCNSCYYDGKEVYSEIPSLGYLFGDEGAGSYLGKKLLESYLKKRMPSDLIKEFEHEYHLSLEEILNSLYNKPLPNRFLASFSHFIQPRTDHPFIDQMVRNSFRDFFDEHVTKYEKYQEMQVNFAGSIAWFYSEILTETAASYGVYVKKILDSPVKGLIEFHSKENLTP